MGWFRAFLLIAAAYAADPTVEQQAVSLDELEALARKKAWSEMVFLLRQVPASERTGRWEALAEQAALGQLDLLMEEGAAGLEGVAESFAGEFPQLRRSQKFQEKRLAATLKGFGQCYDNPFVRDECAGRMLELARRESGDVRLVQGLAELVAERESPAVALGFLPVAFTKGSAHNVCRDPFWKRSLMAGLMSAEAGERARALEHAAGDCWSAVKDEVLLQTDRAPAFHAGFCELLRMKDLLTPPRAVKCADALKTQTSN